MEIKNRIDKFTMLSFKSMYHSSGVEQKVSYEVMFKTFKEKAVRTKETQDEYKKGDVEFRQKCKDKGAFIMGTATNNQRFSHSILTRNMITLDLDHCPKDIFDIIKNKIEVEKKLQFRFFIYSTHSHTVESPRLRMIIPLSKDITPEMYEPIGLQIALQLGLEFFDATTFQPNRIMFFPSVSIDGDYFCESYNDDLFDAEPETLLNLYLDYKNIEEWQRPHWIEGKKREVIERGKFKDSTNTKYRIVNAFNKEYDIRTAIEKFLPDVYKKERNGRYTFLGGSSYGGLVIINAQYAYSHHSNDPAQGKLRHAFDLVAIHKFGIPNYEEEKKEYSGSETFAKMVEFINLELPNVVQHLPAVAKSNEEYAEMQKMTATQNEAQEKNSDEEKNNSTDSSNDSSENGDTCSSSGGSGLPKGAEWLAELERNKNGKILSTADNVRLIFENDPRLKDLFFFDTLKGSICFARAPYWDNEKGIGESITDGDDIHIRTHFRRPPYRIEGKDIIYDELFVVAYKKRINYIKKFLSDLPEWDGKPRCEKLFIDLFDVSDDAFTREASKKWLVGHIARILKPATKFDYSILLIGAVGIGKSVFGKSLATPHWNGDLTTIDNQRNSFMDSELPIGSKEGYDLIRGKTIVEIAEFDKYIKKYEQATLKAFMTSTTDEYREFYGKRAIEVKRSCVFIATTNSFTAIKDPENERRLMPFISKLPMHKAKVYDTNLWSEDIRNQVLAEAMHYYNIGYAFSAPFDEKLSSMWASKNAGNAVENEAMPDVEQYVNNLFMDNFFTDNKTLDSLRENWRYLYPTQYPSPVHRALRNSFSVKEIWAIAMRENKTQIDYHIRTQIEQSFRALGFAKDGSRERQGILGQQYVWRRTPSTTAEPKVQSILLENKDNEEKKESEEINYDDVPW